MFKHGYLLIFLVTFSVAAAERENLSIDRSPWGDKHWYFPNEMDKYPKKSDFSIINYVPMSNDIGERWAVITVKNTSAGTRILTQDHLLGLFANGERIAPKGFRKSVGGKEYLSIAVGFGKNKFPILDIYSKN